MQRATPDVEPRAANRFHRAVPGSSLTRVVASSTLLLALLPSLRAAEPIEVATRHYRLLLNGTNGDIESLVHNGRELIFRSAAPRALFGIRLRQADGKPVDLSALAATRFSAERSERAGQQLLTLHYHRLAGRALDVAVEVRCPGDSPLTFWRLSVQNGTGLMIDHIDFPTVVTPNDLIATGGDGRVFWPAMEGALIEDIERRERGPWRYQPVEHPHFGWIGLYPSSCPMQFMAYYARKAGLYLAAHDDHSHPKGIEFHKHPGGGIQLDFRLFPGGIKAESYAMPYEMVLGVFEGDWHAAAEVYRTWRDASAMPRPPRLDSNPALPGWFEKSPVVVTYPVRGEKDMGDMTPNEYYLYTRAVEPLRRLGQEMGAPVLALLMHWEGSAPWAPPYVWPPHGDAGDFARFVRDLHADGNLVGLYASGVAYTLRSNTDPTYNMEKEFAEKKIVQYVNIAPDGHPATNGVCAGPSAQRIGYDLCPANAWVQDTVVHEVEKILPSGVDYLQYFDQNLGGSSYRCYARSHGHPPAPGVWQNEAMSRIFGRINDAVARSGRKVLIGCESAAAEPFLPYLLFNDLRYSINLRFAIPVPAYAYLNHEYINNFMGNQNSVRECVDYGRSPLNLHQRLAYSFVAGDMLTVVLRGGGKIGWEWGTTWEAPGPDHTSVVQLIRSLNAWRVGVGKPFLVYGRMLKPLDVRGTSVIAMISPGGAKLPFPSLFTSRWQSGSRIAQVVVNYTPDAQTCALAGVPGRSVQLYRQPQAPAESIAVSADGQVPLRIEPLSAVLVEFDGRAGVR